MTLHLIAGFNQATFSEEKCLEFAPNFTAPSNYKDPDKIQAAIAEKRAKWLEDTYSSPYLMYPPNISVIGFHSYYNPETKDVEVEQALVWNVTNSEDDFADTRMFLTYATELFQRPKVRLERDVRWYGRDTKGLVKWLQLVATTAGMMYTDDDKSPTGPVSPYLFYSADHFDIERLVNPTGLPEVRFDKAVEMMLTAPEGYAGNRGRDEAWTLWRFVREHADRRDLPPHLLPRVMVSFYYYLLLANGVVPYQRAAYEELAATANEVVKFQAAKTRTRQPAVSK